MKHLARRAGLGLTVSCVAHGASGSSPVFFCTDVHYDDEAGTACAAALGFWSSGDAEPVRWFVERFEEIAPYQPGEFYRRELPCLVRVLQRAGTTEDVGLVLVDGHAWLQEERPGLGHHLWESLGRRVGVIGVAKSAFVDGCATPVLRGSSNKPLYVSAVGVDLSEAVEFVRRMHGPFRLPTLLAEVDALARRGRPPG